MADQTVSSGITIQPLLYYWLVLLETLPNDNSLIKHATNGIKR